MTGGQQRAAAEVLAAAKTKTARVRLCLDGDLLDEHNRLEAALVDARRQGADDLGDGTAAALAEQILQLEERIREAEVEFVFRGVGRGRWRKLAGDHPPSDEQRAAGANFDVDVFPFEAMAVSLVEPEFTVEELIQLNDDVLDETQFTELWTACLSANLGGQSRPESRAARALLASAASNSEQPSGLGGPEAS